MIAEVIRAARAAGGKIGICGQAPSDYPEFARFLVAHGHRQHLAQPRRAAARAGDDRRRGEGGGARRRLDTMRRADDGAWAADDLGPAKIVHVYEPARGLDATLVVDNVATGPAIGGLRMAPDVTTAECVRLARAMTLKNAAAGLPHGGGKSVLRGDPRMPRERKEALIRAFAHALRHEADYIFGPDMGTDERCMAWVKDEIGRAVGLPPALGGIPLDEVGATGWGIRHAAEVAATHCGLDLQGARVVIQGFGAVGRHSARFLAERGAVLVAASDSQGTILDAGRASTWRG